MAGVIVWPARRVGDRILCGRPAPNGGCRGEIAIIGPVKSVGPAERPGYPDAPGDALTERIQLPRGLTEDPPGSSMWRETAKAQRRRLQGRVAPKRRDPSSGERSDAWPYTSSAFMVPALPLRRRCPTCGTLAEVTAALLSSSN